MEVSQEAVWRLFSPHDPIRPYFLSLPYTFLHLLPTLAHRIQRPLHVLVHARILGVSHICLEGEFAMHLQIQDDHSVCALRFSPAYMEALLGCTAEHLAQLSDSAKEPLYDKLQTRIDSPACIMQLRVQPNVSRRGPREQMATRLAPVSTRASRYHSC